MNIKVQCCGLIILLVIFLFYRDKKTLYTNTEKVFWRLFSAATLCISLDILSVIFITYRSSLPIFLVKVICKVYLASLVGVMILTFIYLCADVFLKNNKYKYITVLLAVVYSLLALIIGVIVGFVGSNIYLSYELEFYLNGDVETNVALGSTYEEEGAVCIFRGVDYSNELEITYYNDMMQEVNTVDTTSLTKYYVSYKIDNS